MNIRFFSSLALLGIAWAGNSFPGSNAEIDTRTLDEIYTAAQSESGELTVLWGGDENYQGDAVRAAWAAAFPKITLNLTVDLSKYSDSNIDRSWERGEEYVDIAILQTLHDFPRWKAQGRLLPYKSATWDLVWPTVKDPEGAFVPFFFFYFGSIIYNPNTLSSADLPKSYADFTLPAWKGKLALTYPNDDDAITYLFSLIIEKYGWGWFETLAYHQDVQWVRGTSTPSAVIAKNSTRSITFSANKGTALFLTETFLPTEQFMSWAQTGAIFQSTKRPESAKLFVSWLLSDESQKYLASTGFWVSRRDILGGPNGTSIFDSRLTEPIGFNKFMLDRTVVERWKLQFETLIGTAQGVSPLHDDL